MRFPPAQRFLCRIGAKCALRHFQGGGVLRALAIFNCQGYGSDDPIAVVLALRAMGTLVLLLRQQRTIAHFQRLRQWAHCCGTWPARSNRELGASAAGITVSARMMAW
jgi:hypothetical protein